MTKKQQQQKVVMAIRNSRISFPITKLRRSPRFCHPVPSRVKCNGAATSESRHHSPRKEDAPGDDENRHRQSASKNRTFVSTASPEFGSKPRSPSAWDAAAVASSKERTNCIKAMQGAREEASSFTSVVQPGMIAFSGSADRIAVAGYAVSCLSEPGAVAVAIKHLKESDAKLRVVIEMHERPSFQKCNDAFLALVRSIVYQQLATKAATAIYGRLVSLCGGDIGINPDFISKLAVAELRSIGISERKASYLHDLAKNFLNGALTESEIFLMEDSKLMSALTAVKGIGAWSVHMFMIFALNKPDVLPVGDLGVRKGFQKLYNLKSLPTAAQMEELAACWQPFRSIGSWYMWRLIGTKTPVASSK